MNKQVFDNVGDFKNGFAIVELNNKLNVIDDGGNLVYKQWFDDIENPYSKIKWVEINGKYNYVKTDGQYISEMWFDMAYGFNNGFASVVIDGEHHRKHNILKENGELLYKTWFDEIGDFEYDSICYVKLDNKYNFINEQGKLVSNVWFDYIDESIQFQKGFAMVMVDGETYMINRIGEMLKLIQ